MNLATEESRLSPFGFGLGFGYFCLCFQVCFSTMAGPRLLTRLGQLLWENRVKDFNFSFSATELYKRKKSGWRNKRDEKLSPTLTTLDLEKGMNKMRTGDQ